MNYWKVAPIIKFYEAMGAVADKRVEVNGNEGKVWASTRNKFYVVYYDPENNSIMTNDNGTYWQGYLGYPAIAFLMVIGKISYNKQIVDKLKGVPWKEINTRFKNDFDKTIKLVIKSKDVEIEAKRLEKQLIDLKMVKLGSKIKPPKGF